MYEQVYQQFEDSVAILGVHFCRDRKIKQGEDGEPEPIS